MKSLLLKATLPAALTLTLLFFGCQTMGESAGSPSAAAKTVTVAQSGQADVVGTDDIALQKAADMLSPGDTLSIGPGVYTLGNSLVIPVSGVTVRGVPGETVLKKAPGIASRVIDGGDWGESDLRVAEPEKFRAGMGVSMTDRRHDGGYYVVTTYVKAIAGDTLKLAERSIHDLDYIGGTASLESKFPVLAAYRVRDLVIEGITADGNKDENPYALDGCRGGAIYLFDCRNCLITGCVARNYNGDGISFQITDSISVINCEATGNTGLGIHPGTGSWRPVVRNCHAHHNGQIGLFLCYRVRLGQFTDNLIDYNGNYGISIGHKDSDNLFTGNKVRFNGFSGVYFRKNELQVGGHRNVFRGNEITDNGSAREGYGVYVEATNVDEVFENNLIAETRAGNERTQQYGVYIKKGDSSVRLSGNTMQGHTRQDVQDENGVALK
ncbi:MAG: right-handed parallel beta-helix repeat-containing protein [Candidatus Glassbacteria bacterium]